MVAEIARLKRRFLVPKARFRERSIRQAQQQAPTMFSDIIKAAFEARLSPLASRVALIVADIDGKTRALRFIDACRREDEARGLMPTAVGTVLR